MTDMSILYNDAYIQARENALDRLEDFRLKRQVELEAEAFQKGADGRRLLDEQKAGRLFKQERRAAKRIQKAMSKYHIHIAPCIASESNTHIIVSYID